MQEFYYKYKEHPQSAIPERRNIVDEYIRPLNVDNDNILVFVQFIPDTVSAENAEENDFEYDLIMYTEEMVRARHRYFIENMDVSNAGYLMCRYNFLYSARENNIPNVFRKIMGTKRFGASWFPMHLQHLKPDGNYIKGTARLEVTDQSLEGQYPKLVDAYLTWDEKEIKKFHTTGMVATPQRLKEGELQSMLYSVNDKINSVPGIAITIGEKHGE